MLVVTMKVEVGGAAAVKVVGGSGSGSSSRSSSSCNLRNTVTAQVVVMVVIVAEVKYRETENLKSECIDFLKSKFAINFIQLMMLNLHIL